MIKQSLGACEFIVWMLLNPQNRMQEKSVIHCIFFYSIKYSVFNTVIIHYIWLKLSSWQKWISIHSLSKYLLLVCCNLCPPLGTDHLKSTRLVLVVNVMYITTIKLTIKWINMVAIAAIALNQILPNWSLL